MVEILTVLDTAELKLTILWWYHELVREVGFDPGAAWCCSVTGSTPDGDHDSDCILGFSW